MKRDKGVAGLTILLSLIVMLFIIGLLVMIFVLMSSRMQNSLDDTAGDNYSKDIINDTGRSLADVVDWFSLFIVIGAMVVLILLTVVIISAIKSGGLMQGSA